MTDMASASDTHVGEMVTRFSQSVIISRRQACTRSLLHLMVESWSDEIPRKAPMSSHLYAMGYRIWNVSLSVGLSRLNEGM